MTTFFADCEAHGTTELRGFVGDRFTAVMVVRERKWAVVGRLAFCPTCHEWVPGRKIDTRGHGSATTACGPKCLTSKRSCDCRCRGKCHGLGRCACA